MFQIYCCDQGVNACIHSNGMLILDVKPQTGCRQLSRWKTIPRTIWMTITQLIMVIVFLLYASALSRTLYVATVNVRNILWASIMIPTASEFFGLKHFDLIYNFMQASNRNGAILFLGLLVGYVYDT